MIIRHILSLYLENISSSFQEISQIYFSYIFYISGISWIYLWYILCLAHVYLLNISRIFRVPQKAHKDINTQKKRGKKMSSFGCFLTFAIRIHLLTEMFIPFFCILIFQYHQIIEKRIRGDVQKKQQYI